MIFIETYPLNCTSVHHTIQFSCSCYFQCIDSFQCIIIYKFPDSVLISLGSAEIVVLSLVHKMTAVGLDSLVVQVNATFVCSKTIPEVEVSREREVAETIHRHKTSINQR